MLGVWLGLAWSATAATAEPPQVALLDPAYELTLFAEHPQIVTPVGATFDGGGRLLVIESNTHFPPQDYGGAASDRIRALEDSDGDGRADRVTTFYEGLVHAMALATAKDGTVYVATRNRILALHDADGDGSADAAAEREIARLETDGAYPHNGLCGLAFDGAGRLWFGLGENLGEPYRLVAADGGILSGGGEGGNVYVCEADGSAIERVATGMWNPFGLCIDPRGRVFCLDNDPDATPHCRLLHVVPGADFGFQFRYGRSGLHPLQAWEGELPATLPAVSDTGEAPCGLVVFDGHLWGASWGHNRLERYPLEARGASWQSSPEIVAQGDHEFRPVDFALAPDGALFFTDWVRASYPVHGHGRVWRLARKGGAPHSSASWPELTAAEQAAAAVRSQAEPGALATDDRFLWQAAVWGLVEHGIPPAAEFGGFTDPRARLGILAAARWRHGPAGTCSPEGLPYLTAALADPDPDVQLTAVRWVSDAKLQQLRPAVERTRDASADDTQLGRAARAALKFLDR